MGGENTEIELRFRVVPEDMAVIRHHPHFADAFQNSAQEKLNSVYFDSDNRFLHNHGLTLRVRHIDDKRVQTIKTTNQGSDWIERSEWEQPIAGDQPDLTRVTDAALRRVLSDDIRDALKPVFETHINRTACHLNGNDTDIVMTLDEGQIVTADSSCPVSQIELELKHGDTAELFKVAHAINEIVPAQLEVKSKSELGYDLIARTPVAAEKGHNPELSAKMSAGRAFTMIGRSCLRHLVANAAATIDRDVEALHQMRVALRKLRASISLFSDFLGDDKIGTIKTELTWLASEFGPARNLDTLIIEVLRPLRKQHPKEPGLASISKLFARQRLKCYQRAREAVQSARFRKLVLDTAEWVEAGSWHRSEDPLRRARLQTPIEIYAAEQLLQRFKKIRRRGAKIGKLGPGELHRLRIQVKKARYAAEFFSSIYSRRKSVKRRKRVLSSLTRLQDSLGRINDIVTHKTLLTDITAIPRPGLTPEQDDRRAFAAGLIMGDQHARIQGLLDSARKAYSRFNDTKSFWKPSQRHRAVSQEQPPAVRVAPPSGKPGTTGRRGSRIPQNLRVCARDFETKAAASKMVAMPGLKKGEKQRILSASPVMIAASLHQMAEKDDPAVAPETLRLPEAVHAGFRQKVLLYREANVLLALMDRVNPSRGRRDPLFEPVFGEYERIIFQESPDPIVRATRRQSVTAALQDLRLRWHPPMGNKHDFARDWSRNWFAGIGHKEMNPTRFERFCWFWSAEYSAVQKALEAAVTTTHR